MSNGVPFRIHIWHCHKLGHDVSISLGGLRSNKIRIESHVATCKLAILHSDAKWKRGNSHDALGENTVSTFTMLNCKLNTFIGMTTAQSHIEHGQLHKVIGSHGSHGQCGLFGCCRWCCGLSGYDDGDGNWQGKSRALVHWHCNCILWQFRGGDLLAHDKDFCSWW